MAINLNIISKFEDKGIKEIEGKLTGLGKSFGKLGGLIAAAFSVTAIANFAKEAVLGAEAAQQAADRLDAVAKSMGIFGENTSVVTTRLNAFAESQEMIVGVDADIIKSTQAKLLTFKALALSADEQGGAFDRATKAALDLAATGFGTAEGNAVQLGKALNDPVKGIAALAKSGVTFTEAEKEKIKALTQSGKMLDAQNLVLAAIETQVGGTAEATATASVKMGLAFNAMKDGVGEALLPAFESLAEILMPVIVELGPKLGEIFEKFVPIIGKVAEVLPSIFEALLPVADVFADFAVIIFDIAADLMPVFIAALDAIMPAVKAILPLLGEFLKDLIEPLVPALMTLVEAFTPLLEAILPPLMEVLEALLPVFTMLMDEAIAALVPIIVDLVDALVPLIEMALPILVDYLTNWVIPIIQALGTIIIDVFTGSVSFIAESLAAIMRGLTKFGTAFRAVWDGVSKFLKDVVNGILGVIQGMVNGVIDGVNMLIKALNRIQFTVPSWIPGLGGESFGFAIPELKSIRIPQLAEGGIVMPKPGGTLANIAEAGRPEAVIPLDRMGDMGKTVNLNITVNAGMGADGGEIGRQIVDQIIRYEKSSGRVFARA
jgi:phage-related protein